MAALPVAALTGVHAAEWRLEDEDPRNVELWEKSWDDESMQGNSSSW